MDLAKQAGAAAFSACVAEIFTIPMDTVKVRLQMQSTVTGGQADVPKDVVD